MSSVADFFFLSKEKCKITQKPQKNIRSLLAPGKGLQRTELTVKW